MTSSSVIPKVSSAVARFLGLKPDAALAVFMKAPVPGRCKTRLVPPLTPEQAAGLYKAFCRDILRAVQSLPADVWITYDSSPEFPTPAWTGTNAPFFEQKGNHLGERLVHAFETLFKKGYSRVAAIGTDAPALPVARIQEGFAALKSHDVTFGPAEDGGYYLVGLRSMRRELFEEIPWSTEAVLSKTREILARHSISAAFLPGFN